MSAAVFNTSHTSSFVSSENRKKKSTMPPKYDRISDIHALHGNWNVLVGVIRKWHVSDIKNSKLPYSLELVLIDSEGDKMHASIRKSLIYRYESDLKEGCVYHMSNFSVAANTGAYRTTRHPYKLTFQYTTKIKRVDNVAIPMNNFRFTNPADCFKDGFDSDYLIDLIGVLTGLGTEREYEKNGVKTKVLTMELDNNGYRFQITLFGSYVDELNSFIASGESTNAVVAILFAKCKDFQGKPVLQNSIKASKLLFNPDNTEADALRKRIAENPESPIMGLSQLGDSPKLSEEDDFLTLTKRLTIDELKECKEEAIFAILAKVNCIVDEENWWYTACRCNKKVYADSNMFFCEKCNRHVVNVVQRYRLQLRIIDDTASATFVLFDREATALLNSSCAVLIDAMNMDQNTLPTVISDLVGKTYLFKVECPLEDGSRYERSYRVKRVCTTADIIDKFKQKYSFQDNITSDDATVCEAVVADVVDKGKAVAQDLLEKFAEADNENSKIGNVIEVVDLGGDAMSSPTITKSCTFLDKQLANTTEFLLKKQIKIEKE